MGRWVVALVERWVVVLVVRWVVALVVRWVVALVERWFAKWYVGGKVRCSGVRHHLPNNLPAGHWNRS